MADFKLTINNAKGLSVQRESKDPQANALLGKKIGEKIEGSLIGLSGYEFEITGGSDDCGFPMRWDVPGVRRKKILAVKGVGIKRKLGRGIKQRKTVCGNTIHENIVQINLKILKQGKEDLGFKAPERKKGKKEAKKEEKKPEPKEAPKKEEKPKPSNESEKGLEKSKTSQKEKKKEESKKEEKK